MSVDLDPTRARAAVTRLNALSRDDARARFHTCCGCARWAEAMAAARPFADVPALHAAAMAHWRALDRQDLLEAFSHHPRIGERNLSQAKFAATVSQSSREQSGMAGASDAERAEFQQLNERYERRFGHVFLICATGKSAAEMLAQVRRRIENSHEQELNAAAEQQAMITAIRLDRLLAELAGDAER